MKRDISRATEEAGISTGLLQSIGFIGGGAIVGEDSGETGRSGGRWAEDAKTFPSLFSTQAVCHCGAGEEEAITRGRGKGRKKR